MLLFGDFSIFSLVAIGMVLLFGMGIHEAAHAYMADYWGDPTPRENGRLTINPIVHINWIGWAMFLLIGFGILGSVPVNENRMRDRKWGSFWTSFAGPLSNLAQAIGFGLAIRLLGMVTPVDARIGASLLGPSYDVGYFSTPLWDFLSLFLFVGVLFNVLLFVFNLLPFFPFDGWHMMHSLLPPRGIQWKEIPYAVRKNARPLAAFLYEPHYKWGEWAQVSMYAFFILLMVGFVVPQLDILSRLISLPTFRITFLLAGV